MSQKILFISCLLLLAASSCKRVCYTCNQYCAYCYKKSDTTVITKICATGSASEYKVNKAIVTLRDSGYTCNMLVDNPSVCDTKNGITGAIDYYRKKDYFCEPKE